jgi:putative ATP-dependent endonuclease of OLD family
MRLARISVENFRGIRHLEIELDPVTVIIGENNTGKTSVLDVLALCLGRPGGVFATHFRRADFHRPASGASPRPIGVSLTFSASGGGPPFPEALQRVFVEDRDGDLRAHVLFTGHPADGRVDHRFTDEDGRPLDPRPPASALEELRRMHPVLLLRFAQDPGPRALEADGSSSSDRGEGRRRRELEAEVARSYHELSRARGPVPGEHLRRGLAAATELYRSMRPGRLGGLAPLQAMIDALVPDPDEGNAASRGTRELERAGSGSHTLALLMVLGAMLDTRGDTLIPEGVDPIIAIEEPEVHLHPILLASIWDVIESLGAQTLVTTNSGELLSSVPMGCLRRLSRRDGRVRVDRLRTDRLSVTELRRVGYHIRATRGGALFSRCWLLVEGESEFWLLRHLARVLGHDLDAEGVRCVEFAQCGVGPLVKVARDLGIEWHLLADGDRSGAAYVAEAEQHLNGDRRSARISRLPRRDIERCFWYHGYEHVYRRAAGLQEVESAGKGALRPGSVIARAVRARSKPYLALTVAEEAATRGPEGVPPVLRRAIEASLALARASVREGPA